MKAAVASLAFSGAASALSIDHLAARQAFVDEINAVATTWTAHVPSRFAGLPLGAMRPMLGVKPDNMEMIDADVASGEIVISENKLASFPEHFDSAEAFPECADMINDIRDQSNCGCCWAFAVAEAASDRMCVASMGALKMPLSAQDLCFNSNYNGCDGGQPSSAWNYIHRSGLVTGGQYNSTLGYCSDYSLPHCHHHGPQRDDPYPAEGAPGCPSQRSPLGPKACDANARGNHTDFTADKYSFTGRVTSFRDEESIMTALMNGGPVATAFSVYSDFENYAGGIYQHTRGTMEGGHAVKIVGWGVEAGVKYWKVANSWNPWWGENGYFRIIRGRDECGIERQAIASSDESSYGKKN